MRGRMVGRVTHVSPTCEICNRWFVQVSFQTGRHLATLDSMAATHQCAADGPSLTTALYGNGSKGHMRRGEVDHWMLPGAAVPQRNTLQDSEPSNEGASPGAFRSLQANSNTHRCKGAQRHTESYNSGTVWEKPATVQLRVADPELTAALKPERGCSAVGMNSDMLSAGNHICGMLFDHHNSGNRSGLQYTLGGVDCAFSGKAAAWDAPGKERVSHRRFHRARR